MEKDKKLGKIESINFGLGGYQGAMLGLNLVFSGESWAVSDFKGAWDPILIECDEHCKWIEEDRSKQFIDTINLISKLLTESKVNSIDQLKGKPVEVEFEGNTLKGWRILKEVL